MKILFLTPFLPCDPKLTSRIRASNWLKFLSAKHSISLATFIEPGEGQSQIDSIRRFCTQIKAVPRKVKSGFWARAKNIFEANPYYLHNQFYSSQMQEAVDALLKENQFDLIHVSTLVMAQYVFSVKGTPKILEGMDCQTRNYLQHLRHPINLGNRIVYFIDWSKLKKYEPLMHSYFDRSILINPVDRDFLLSLRGDLNIQLVSQGVDPDYFRPQAESGNPSLVFTGDMGYTPNADAMLFFCARIFPIIEKEFPGIKLHILGKNPERIKNRDTLKNNILIEDFVPDVRPFLAQASVFVCPLRIGTGVKNKVLEALAMAKPVVSTSLGIEGISVSAGKEVLLADTPELFAREVIRLLKDKELRGTMSAQARTAVEKFHSWETLAAEMDEMYQKTAAKLL